MKKSFNQNLIGCRINQKLSFSPLFAKSTKGAKVFWPGCNLLQLEPDIIDKTYDALAEIIPGLGFSSFCCGKPSLHVQTEKNFFNRVDWLNCQIKTAGIKEAYTACPNCQRMLEQYTSLQPISVWEVLDKHFPVRLLGAAAGETWALHDPCAARSDNVSQQAVRSILDKAGVEIKEFAHNGAKTRCCGNIDMLMVLDQQKGRTMLEKRLAETPGDVPVVSYCQGCSKSFSDNGQESRHLIELLFGKSSSCNWLNRYKNVSKNR